MKRIALPLILALALIASLCFVGCETESGNENNVRITPAAAVILLNQTIELIASGGFEYEWSLEQEEWGTLSTRQGDRVLYTSHHDPGADDITAQQVITVSSTLDNAGGESNTLDYVKSAEAVITHQTVQTTVTITPPNASVKQFESASFTASGANTYSWSLQYETWGSLTARQGPNTTYTSLESPGAEERLQVLTCTTDRGTVSAHIIHEPEGVVITPTTAALSPGQSVTFTATSGGTPNWSISGSGAPHVDTSTSGNSFTVTFDPGENFDDINNPRVVTVTASVGDTTAQGSVSLYGTL